MDSLALQKKLRMTDDQEKLIMNAPENYLSALSTSYDQQIQTGKQYNFVQIFAEQLAELKRLAKLVSDSAKYDCVFWFCYPKQSGKIKSDLKRETVWEAMQLIGLRPVSQIAIDETWSALRARPPELVK
ncbi:MAG: DUF3052 domain-containing protein [Calditrichaeota bacterium]|nr:DUF3052 domain-containing protein [Calditrichota bacterium]